RVIMSMGTNEAPNKIFLIASPANSIQADRNSISLRDVQCRSLSGLLRRYETHHRPSEAVLGVSIPRCDKPNNKRRDQTQSVHGRPPFESKKIPFESHTVFGRALSRRYVAD